MALHQFQGVHFAERPLAEKIGAAFDKRIPAALVRVVMDEAWVTLPAGEWMVACRLVMQASQPVIGEVRIFPKDPASWGTGGITTTSDPDFDMKVPLRWNGDLLGLSAKGVPAGGITRRLLRDIPLGSARKEIGQFLREARSMPQFSGLFLMFAEAMLPALNPPRRGKSDLFYARLAEKYVQRVNAGSRSPNADLQRRYPRWTLGQVRDRIRQARERQLLETVKHGIPGGQLTARAMALLQEHRPPAGKRQSLKSSKSKMKKKAKKRR